MARRIALESSNLHSLSWQKTEPVSDVGELDIWFKTRGGGEGSHYRYFDVPANVVVGLIFAESQGTFFNENVKSGASDGQGYRVERIT